MFDPYRDWLGVPDGPRPPSPAGLLGITPEESDPGVIESAATRRAAAVRNFRDARNARVCDRILVEIDQARAALLDPARRRASPSNQEPAPTAAPLPISEPLRLREPKPPRRSWGSVAKSVAPLLVPLGVLAALGFLAAGDRLSFRPPWEKAAERQVAKGEARDADQAAAQETDQAAKPSPRPAMPLPAVYDVLLDPPDATLSILGMDPGVTRGVGRERLEFARADGTKRAYLVASRDGYKTVKEEVFPAPGEHRVLEFRLVSDPNAKRGNPSTARPEVSITKEEVRQFKGTEDILCAAFTPDGSRVLTGCRDGFLRCWDASSGKIVDSWKAHEREVALLSFVPDDRRSAALSYGKEGAFQLWDVKTAKLLDQSPKRPEPVNCMVVGPGGSRVLCGLDGEAVLWGIKNGRVLHRFPASGSKVLGVAFSPDGKLAVTAHGDNLIRIWNVADGGKVRDLVGHSGPVVGLSVTIDGLQIVSGSDDGTLRLWEAATGKEVRRFDAHAGRVLSLAVSAAGRRALSGSEDGSIRLWDLESSQELHRFNAHTGGVVSLAFSPDGHYALSLCKDKRLRLWEVPR